MKEFKMKIPEGATEAATKFDWIFEVDGEKKVISNITGKFPSFEGDFITVETEFLEKGYEPPILDLYILDSPLDDIDYTDVLMQEEKLLIFVFYDISKMKSDAIVGLKETIKVAMDNEYKIIGLTASGESDVNWLESKYEVELDFYFCDETALKTIVRSNPGALKIHEGSIIQKTHWNDFKSLDLTNL